jgi:hypothetical protein
MTLLRHAMIGALAIACATCAACASREPGERPRELTTSEVVSYPDGRGPGPGGRFFGTDLLGTYRGQRFVAEYICSDVCPQYTVVVHHFVDLRSEADCTSFGGAWQAILVPMGIGIGRRNFCVPAR